MCRHGLLICEAPIHEKSIVELDAHHVRIVIVCAHLHSAELVLWRYSLKCV